MAAAERHAAIRIQSRVRGMQSRRHKNEDDKNSEKDHKPVSAPIVPNFKMGKQSSVRKHMKLKDLRREQKKQQARQQQKQQQGEVLKQTQFDF